MSAVASLFFAVGGWPPRAVYADGSSSPAWELGAAEYGQAAIPRYKAGQILVKPKKSVPDARVAAVHAAHRARAARVFRRIGRLQVVELPAGADVPEMAARYKDSGLFEYAEPDFILRAAVTEPNDPRYLDGSLWALKNTGQYGGVPYADIRAAEAWDTLHDAPNMIVAVIDSGVRFTHEDLAGNMWVNPGEIPGNNVDDDANGYVDDIYGINAITGSGNPDDDNGHGTHVAGIVGAVGNNARGVVGVAWQLKIIACKFLNVAGQGATSDAIECVEYARSKGARVINCSWAGTDYSQALRDALEAAQYDGIVVTAAAGNDTEDNDVRPTYPASYDLDNIISVAATDNRDSVASFSNYGLESVDLAAPGVGITSTYRFSDSSYRTLDGTSTSAPYVAGAVALLKTRFPSDDCVRTVGRVLNSVDPIPELQTKSKSGGRLNLRGALTYDLPNLFVVPAAGLGFGGMPGGPMIPASRTYTLTNFGTNNLSWQVTNTQSWLNVYPAGGVLAPNERVSVTLTLTAAANSLPSGTYSDVVSFVNLTNGSGNTFRIVRLVIGPIYVSTGGSDTNPGSSWLSAKRTVQAGIDAAVPGAPVWVASGTYVQNITLKDGIKLYGGFAGTETEFGQRDWIANPTILDGNRAGSVVVAAPGTRSDTVIDGFTIRNGSGLPTIGYSEGGGVYCNHSWATIINNRITSNTASYRGAGVYCYYGAPLICGNEIVGNTAAEYGGGIYSYRSSARIINNTMIANNAGIGGGALSTNSLVTIIGNIAAFGSSGLHAGIGGGGTIRNNCVYGNAAYNYSGISPGPGDISQDPMLVNRGGGDYRLSATSPCINAGWNDVQGLPEKDRYGNSRIWLEVVDIGAAEFWPPPVSLSDMKRLADTAWAAGNGLIVTSVFPDYFYVESDDRSSGLRVEKTAHGLSVGKRADLIGTMRTNADGERYLSAVRATVGGSGSLAPISMINRSVGGGDWFYNAATGAGQKGMAGSLGLNNVGLLVQAWGAVTEARSDKFWIDDGTANVADIGHLGVRVDSHTTTLAGIAREGMILGVTGISSCVRIVGGDVVSRLLPVGDRSITVASPRDTLLLNIPADCRSARPGSVIEVKLYQTDFSTLLAGYQVFLSFDPNMLSIAPSDITLTPEPYGLQLYKSVGSGTVGIAAGANAFGGQPGTQSAALLATLRFTVLSVPGQTQIRFRTNNPPSRVTDAEGYAAFMMTLDSPVIEVLPGSP